MSFECAVRVDGDQNLAPALERFIDCWLGAVEPLGDNGLAFVLHQVGQWHFFHGSSPSVVLPKILTAGKHISNTGGFCILLTDGYKVADMSKKKPLSESQLAECQALNNLFLAKKNVLKLSQKKVADAAGISPAAVTMYLNGTNALNARIAAVFAEMLQVPVSAFSARLDYEIDRMVDARQGASTSETPISAAHEKESNVITADFTPRTRLKDGDLQIPQFDVRGSMGGGQMPADYIEVIRYVTMHKSHLEMLGITYSSAENLALMTGWGQSMKGTINHGEPVFVDRGINSFIGDGIYCFTWDGLVYLKRLQKESKTHFRVISDNSLHESFAVPMNEVFIHARALLAWNANKL